MKAIYLKELRNYFKTPLGYVFMAFMLVIFGVYFMLYCLLYTTSDYSTVLNGVTMLILFALPLLTMRIFSEESKNKTDQLLLTAPVSTWKIVLGKYLAAMTLFTITLLITVSQPLMLKGLGAASMPTAKIIGGYIGFWLYGFAFISIGMLISSLTDNQLVAAIASIGAFMLVFLLQGIANVLPTTHFFALMFLIVVIVLVCLLLYRAIRSLPVTCIVGAVLIAVAVVLYFVLPGVYDNLLLNVFGWISLTNRYSNFYSGIFDFSNVVYYLSFSALIVFLTTQVIEKKRWS